jgi:hypothetical protein
MRLLGGCLLAAVMALSACSSAPTTGGGSSGSSGSTGLPIPPTTGGGGGGGATDRPSAPTAGLPTPSTDRDDGEADQDPTAGPAEGEADPDLGADADVDADAEVDAGTDIDVGAAGGVDQRFPEEPAMTAEERKEALARRLDQSLNDFDSTLEGEQRRTAAERDARTASAAGALGDGPEEYAGGGERSGDLRSERTRRQGAVAGGPGGPGGPGGSSAAGGGRDRGAVGAGSGAPDRGIPSGDDDDIVARRLRRAAEQETDPELKEKLWQEYIEYKRNAQG